MQRVHNLSPQRDHRVYTVGMINLFRRRAADRPQHHDVPSRPGWAPTHQHRKGGYYRVVGHAILEADRSPVTLYDDAEGTTWVRATEEFEDGRFRALTDPPI